jgi:hypothetical protein
VNVVAGPLRAQLGEKLLPVVHAELTAIASWLVAVELKAIAHCAKCLLLMTIARQRSRDVR